MMHIEQHAPKQVQVTAVELQQPPWLEYAPIVLGEAVPGRIRATPAKWRKKTSIGVSGGVVSSVRILPACISYEG